MNDPNTLIFVFQGFNPWRQSGKFPIGRSWLNMESNIKLYHMLLFDIFCHQYFMKYINDFVVPETIKYLKSIVFLGEYLHGIGCRLTMTCYVGHSVRDLFSKYPITPKKGTHIRLNHIISGRRLEKITQAMSYTNIPIPNYDYPLFKLWEME